MYIHRTLEDKVRKYLPNKEIIAILGPRQSGKTTLMQKIASECSDVNFLSFDDREILTLFTEDIKSFVKIHVENYKYLFIDEVQYAQDGGKQLKYIYDNCNIKIIISGSSASELSLQSIKFLVGRVFLFNLYPFSFEEFLKYKNENLFKIYTSGKYSEPILNEINKLYEEFVIFGGYPRVVLSKDNNERSEVLKGIYNTYFLKEIKEILQLKDDFKLGKLIKILAINCSNIINYDELSAVTNFTHNELLANLNILNKTYITIDSKPYFTNKNKEIVKAPKYFFLDNGLRNYIIGNFQAINSRTDMGPLNENFVASEICKCDVELHYWRSKAKAEVDFVLEKDSKILPVEVKSELSTEKITRSFRNFVSEYKLNKGYILSYRLQSVRKEDELTIHFEPLFSIRRLIFSF